MSPEIIILLVAIVVIIAVGLAVMWPTLRRQRLRRRFGPEYDRVVQDRESHQEAERELLSRERRRAKLDIRPLEPATREYYRSEWMAAQKRFVDEPAGAAGAADRLVTAIMTERGYPTEGYEQRLVDLSVDHARTLDHYRHAHEIGSRAADDEVSTEELRRAMVHYRILFDELLGEDEHPHADADMDDRHRAADEVRAGENAGRNR